MKQAKNYQLTREKVNKWETFLDQVKTQEQEEPVLTV